MIWSICKQSALTFILADTSLLDRIMQNVGKDLLFESLDLAWMWLWISSDKHPSAILVYFSSPKYFIFKNYFSRWIYFTIMLIIYCSLRIKSMLEAGLSAENSKGKDLNRLLPLTVWDQLGEYLICWGK